MNNEYTIEDYVRQNPDDAHIKLYVHFLVITPKEEMEGITDDMILHFDLGGMVYNISLGDLKAKVREESDKRGNGKTDI